MKYFLLLLLLSPARLIAGTLTETQEISKVLDFSAPGAAKTLLVDNINGAIAVHGANIQQVELEVIQTIEAESDEKLKIAAEEVQLLISEKNNRIELFVDGPFRRPDGSIHHHGKKYFGYEVCFDFKIKVPDATRLFLRTIDNGDIRVQSVSGDFEVKNVNGGIEMRDISGSGEVHGINRDVVVTYRENPARNCAFTTINGELEIYFPEEPQANFNLDVFNGDVYSDFSLRQAYKSSFTKSRKGGRNIYKIEPEYNAVSGKGGPKIKLKSLNGDIFIRRAEN